MNKINVTCKVCGKNEMVFKSRSKKYVTCSTICLGKLNSKRYTTKVKNVCVICKVEFEVKLSHSKRRICCSNECGNKYRSIYKIGENNSNYRTISKIENGIKVKDYSRYKDPYHKIVKDWFGLKKLIKGYDIHHRDCDHNNNEITNLVLLPRSAHMLLHRFLGNILLRAYSKGLITKEILFSYCTEEQVIFLKEVIDLNIMHQAVVKQGELLENPEVDNQQPSVYRNIYEGSTTNGRVLSSNVEDSNSNTSALPI